MQTFLTNVKNGFATIVNFSHSLKSVFRGRVGVVLVLESITANKRTRQHQSLNCKV